MQRRSKLKLNKKNMNKNTVSIILLLFLFGNTFAQLDSYNYKRKLDKVSQESSCGINLSPEITARCKSNLNDIRIYNLTEKDTIEIPFIINRPPAETEITIPFELINDTHNEKCCSYITLKFPKKQIINRIKLDIAEINFDKILKIEGSNDNKEWFTISEHERIVRFQNMSETFSYTTLDFQNTEYAYFRLKFDDDSNEKITVLNAYAFENRTVDIKTDSVKISKYVQTENKKDKTSVLMIDLPYNYMLNYLTLESKGKTDFYRNVNIYRLSGTYHTNNGEEETWEVISSGVIESNKKNKLNLYGSQTSKLKIEVLNYDDQPITLSNVKLFSEQINLLSKLPASETIYLAYGKENAGAPVYDLIHFQEKFSDAVLGIQYGPEEMKPIIPNAPKEQLITNKKWLWVVMGTIILIIGYFALNMLKKETQGK